MLKRQKKDGTRTVLLDDLSKKLAEHPELREGIAVVMRNASKGYYDDFETPVCAPKHELAVALGDLGFDDMARVTMAGKYDG